ncbi:pilus assembly protein [Chelatococcus sp. SYSU_G07232]|uniref:Pilus assembly protein n=1 Tax=Chelatococcus albus TaxID=3047466 RepID=A0ABT7AIM2_9HYPH|nr:pilus assembly protein [Chelatococcus sp. SYSU_G07232]MDJ1159218.1 pilus assembly protein [Chelatococcus sp. SYSU_G07232]
MRMLSALQRFLIACQRSEAGNIVVWFALALTPLMLGIGSTIDYTRAASLRAKLQQVTDATVLAIAPMALSRSDAEVTDAAKRYFAGAMAREFPGASTETMAEHAFVDSVTISSARTEVKIRTVAYYEPVFMAALASGVGQTARVTLGAFARSLLSNDSYEIALVLDNSGSMASSAGGKSKMDATKEAALKLVDALFPIDAMVQQTATSGPRMQISLVPFTISVKVGKEFKDAPWIDTAAKSPIHWNNLTRDLSTPGAWVPASRFKLFEELGVEWAGCVEARRGDWGVKDIAADYGSTTSADAYFVPQFAPDEPGDKDKTRFYLPSGAYYTYNNSYLNDNGGACSGKAPTDATTLQNRVCKYKINKNAAMLSTSRGPNYNCDAMQLVRLTDRPRDPGSVVSSINAMRAAGNTDLLEGFMWGWRSISPNAPFRNGRNYGAPNNHKVVILMTDGMNAWNSANNPNKSVYSPFGYYTNDRFAPQFTGITTSGKARDALDARTLQACANAKADGVTVYTVGFSTSTDPIDDKGLALLKQCATPDDAATGKKYAFVANDSAQIVQVFEEIARNLGSLRIAE